MRKHASILPLGLLLLSPALAQQPCGIVQIVNSGPGVSARASLEGGAIAFESSSDLTGGNADGNSEIFLYDGVSITQVTDSTSGGSAIPSLNGGAIGFLSTSDLTGSNADGSYEIFLASCGASGLAIPTEGPLGLAILVLLLALAGALALRRAAV